MGDPFEDSGVIYRSPIGLGKVWADVLNAFFESSNSTIVATFIDSSMEIYRTTLPERENFGLDDMYNLILSTVIANGLASIGTEYLQNVAICKGEQCSQGLVNISQVLIFDGTEDESNECGLGGIESNASVYSQLSQYLRDPGGEARNSQWTEISFPIFKYGYGWSFTPSTVKSATVILLLHALIVIIHVCYVLFAGLSYSFADDIAELLALALESKPPEIFNTSKLPKCRDRIWTRSTMVRQAEEDGRLELVVDEGLKNC